MFKKVIIALAVAFALPVIASAQKFGVVDVQTVMEALPDMTAARNQLQEANKKYEGEFQMLNEEMNKKYQEFQALAADTPDSIKERRLSEIQEMEQKLQAFRQTVSEDLQRQQQQLMLPIQQKLMDAIKAVGQEGSYTFIFELGAAAYTGADVVDVTPAVKTKLGL